MFAIVFYQATSGKYRLPALLDFGGADRGSLTSLSCAPPSPKPKLPHQQTATEHPPVYTATATLPQHTPWRGSDGKFCIRDGNYSILADPLRPQSKQYLTVHTVDQGSNSRAALASSLHDPSPLLTPAPNSPSDRDILPRSDTHIALLLQRLLVHPHPQHHRAHLPPPTRAHRSPQARLPPCRNRTRRSWQRSRERRFRRRDQDMAAPRRQRRHLGAVVGDDADQDERRRRVGDCAECRRELPGLHDE